jgi:prepilin-type N-terminal cleavage/methylation domain-containing protein
MKLPTSISRRGQRAFTLLELMVAVGLMGVIVAALYSVFNFTQKAMRSNASQTDVLEGGRFAMAIVVDDVRKLSAAGPSPETNFMYGLSPAINTPPLESLKPAQLLECYYETNRPKDFSGYLPTVQALDLGKYRRTNVLQDVFLFSRVGTRSEGTAYRVINARGGVGTLARSAASYDGRLLPKGLLSIGTVHRTANPTNFTQILDGVVHFRMQAFDPLGYPMTLVQATSTNMQRLWREFGYELGTNLIIEADKRLANQPLTIFRSNALPAAVEIELGILEPETLAQFRQLPAGTPFAERFLSNHASQVQIFRQRIPIWQAPPQETAQFIRP